MTIKVYMILPTPQNIPFFQFTQAISWSQRSAERSGWQLNRTCFGECKRWVVHREAVHADVSVDEVGAQQVDGGAVHQRPGHLGQRQQPGPVAQRQPEAGGRRFTAEESEEVKNPQLSWVQYLCPSTVQRATAHLVLSTGSCSFSWAHRAGQFQPSAGLFLTDLCELFKPQKKFSEIFLTFTWVKEFNGHFYQTAFLTQVFRYPAVRLQPPSRLAQCLFQDWFYSCLLLK